jgi:hypothetical protein
MIRDSLSRIGVSPQYVEVSNSEHTGFSFEIHDKTGKLVEKYLDPGASVGLGAMNASFERYLQLCDVLVVNQQVHPEVSWHALRLASQARIPSIFVACAPFETRSIREAEWIFVDTRSACGSGPQERSHSKKHGLTFVLTKDALSLLGDSGTKDWFISVPETTSADEVVIRLIHLASSGKNAMDVNLARSMLDPREDPKELGKRRGS